MCVCVRNVQCYNYFDLERSLSDQRTDRKRDVKCPALHEMFPYESQVGTSFCLLKLSTLSDRPPWESYPTIFEVLKCSLKK